MATPDCADSINQGQIGIRVLCHIQHTEIILNEVHSEANKSNCDPNKEGPRSRPGNGHQMGTITLGAHHWKHREDQRSHQRQDHRILADFCNHFLPPYSFRVGAA